MSNRTMTPAQLKAARAELRLTQTEMAAALGMSRPSIARMEAGGQDIEQRTAMAVALLLLEYREPPR